MQNATRKLYTALLIHLATLNGVASAAETFTVDPTIQQKLEKAIQESSAYLSLINMIGVTEKSGATLKLGASGPIASRTNTATTDRNPRDISSLANRTYDCTKTDFDTAIPYALLDAWAKFPNFQTLLRDVIVKQQALDRLMIGWNGTSIAVATNLADNPLLQDVNKGWLQHLREDAPARVMSTGTAQAGEVRVGPGGDYENLDALVFDVVQLMDPWYQEDTSHRVHLGRKLMHDKYFPKINQKQGAQDELASQLLVAQKSVGGLQGLVVPYFPANSLLITRPDNLSIYYQDGGRRRSIQDEPKRDRIANYESSNDAYVVEDYGAAVLVENITLGDWSAG